MNAADEPRHPLPFAKNGSYGHYSLIVKGETGESSLGFRGRHMPGPTTPASGPVALPKSLPTGLQQTARLQILSKALQNAGVSQKSADTVVQQQAQQQEAACKVWGVMWGETKCRLVSLRSKAKKLLCPQQQAGILFFHPMTYPLYPT